MAWPVFLGMSEYTPRFAARRRLAALESGAVAFSGGGQGFEVIARAIEEQALPGQHRRRRRA